MLGKWLPVQILTFSLELIGLNFWYPPPPPPPPKKKKKEKRKTIVNEFVCV